MQIRLFQGEPKTVEVAVNEWLSQKSDVDGLNGYGNPIKVMDDRVIEKEIQYNSKRPTVLVAFWYI